MSRLPPFPDCVSPARLDWRDGTPVALDFDDVYFSRDGGPAETRHVFLDGNGLPRRLTDPALTRLVIGETGFGTGLNFLVAAQEFLRVAPPEAQLHFVSVEKFPLSRADLARAHAPWPELASPATELRANWPEAVAGFHHRVLFGGRVRLTLLLGDAAALLSRLDARVDAWFLDGFAPAKNADLWTPGLFGELARLSAPGATLATFTAAGDVKRGLQAAGFRVEKVAGFGRKREMLRGAFGGKKSIAAFAAPADHGRSGESRNQTSPTLPRTAAVIGGGLAGCAAARALAERGITVTLFEKNARLADETSGNLAGAVHPKFSLHETPQNRWYRDSYLFALSRLPQILGEPDRERWDACGLLQLPNDDGGNLQGIADSGRWPGTVLRHIDAGETAALTGIALPRGGLWFEKAAWVNPPALCAALAAHPGIRVRTGHYVRALEHDGSRPLLDGRRYDIVVVANALAASAFPLTATLPLRRVRGQVSHVVAGHDSLALKAIVCHDGYATPAREGLHCVGATFGPRDRDPAVRENDHRENLDKLAAACPPLFMALGGERARITGGRTGFRTQSPDYLPLIGRVVDESAIGADDARPPVPTGLYTLTALGARGIAFSLLGAEIVAAQACREPMPVDSEVAAALAPARFLLRAQRRRQKHPTQLT